MVVEALDHLGSSGATGSERSRITAKHKSWYNLVQIWQVYSSVESQKREVDVQ